MAFDRSSFFRKTAWTAMYSSSVLLVIIGLWRTSTESFDGLAFITLLIGAPSAFFLGKYKERFDRSKDVS